MEGRGEGGEAMREGWRAVCVGTGQFAHCLRCFDGREAASGEGKGGAPVGDSVGRMVGAKLGSSLGSSLGILVGVPSVG